MREDLKYPSNEAVRSVLIKIGADPSSRYNQHYQDIEYTTCRLNELEKYIELYTKDDTTLYEKRVLGCYFLACLNEYIQEQDKLHPLQEFVFSLLYSDKEIHKTEISYWSDTSEPDRGHWWPIAESLSQWLEQHT